MRRRAGPIDFWILLPAVLLLGIGIIMVFSASALTSSYNYGDAFYFLKRQLAWSAIGLSGLFFTMQCDYTHLRRLATPFLGLAIILLMLVLIIGTASRGSARWLGVGSLSFQPSETIKLAMVIFLAASLAQNRQRLHSLAQGIGPYLALMALVCLLILAQPDLGTAVAVAGTTYLMLMVAGADKGHLALLAALGVAAVALAIVIAPYRMARFTAFLDPWADPQGKGYQTIQSLLAIGSGGLFGTGLGQGRQKLYYVPENHTDFIFAILSEELGFIGAALVVILFLILVWRGFHTAFKAPDAFGSFLAAGLTIMLALQALINMGVVTGLLPVTGITLPLLSYGGSSLIFSLLGVGILLNISRYAQH
ncbi:putative peptidoglycan glycosyltransferase FtsW [Neomoorella glycerini]|uniref:Probable peptidoglycan glycosyltransferase FtsW n=1 Tax=Neomoorella glycerini TaxID=55779 RepID=A0A6I5ZSA6_9FIRM|nr:putative lipid II flippase FtsW [Moorella glycerini]QGP92923.1 putative peptidoglycan glycosyltransferase FtsW [Moorella glycerini]